MVRAALRRFLAGGLVPAVLLSLLLIASLFMMSAATQDSARFGNLYTGLVVVNLLGVLALLAVLVVSLVRLIRQARERVMGSRLTLRLLGFFVIAAILPLSIVYLFSVQAFQRGIDNWFDVRIEKALDNALALGRTALDTAKDDLTRHVKEITPALDDVPPRRLLATLDALRDQYHIEELTLFSTDGQVIATSSDPLPGRKRRLLPEKPGEAVLTVVRQGQLYANIEPLGHAGLRLRVVTPVMARGIGSAPRILQVLQPLPPRYAELGVNVQTAFAEYEKLVYLRNPLKFGFVLTLSLVALSALLMAVWASIFIARRLATPIRDLAEGTRAVARGDYRKQIPVTSADEVGVLVQSFNVMTRRIARAQAEIRRSQREAEESRSHLETVLTHLSSGVLSFDVRGRLRTHNAAAVAILGVDLARLDGQSVDTLRDAQPSLAPFFDNVREALERARREWQAEITLTGPAGRRVLMARGTSLPGLRDRAGGHVVVFDDITTLIQAQRDAAWSEVARRLAHEIRNPLTPIQLSAERLRQKCLPALEDAPRDTLDRATHTIIQQVEAMKSMVNAFAEYARPVALRIESLDLNQVVREVAELYRGREHGLAIALELDESLPAVPADATRLRQVLHNLILNARDALAQRADARVTLSTRRVAHDSGAYAELDVRDNGPGFPQDVIDRAFEPYVTTKEKGTGLGLAIVKRIAEEHHGSLRIANGADGATVTLRLPLSAAPSRAAGGAP